jgi:PKD repeat protein
MRKRTVKGKAAPVRGIIILLLITACLVGVAAADDYVGGLPLTTVQTGTVTGDLYIAGNPPTPTFVKVVDRTFTLPAAAVAESGRIKWARLYVSVYCGHMQDPKAISYTTKADWNNDGTWDTTWTESPPNQIFHYMQGGDYGGGGNDNSGFPGHGTGEPYLMINDHTTRVTSDYFSWYDVTNLIQVGQPTIKVNVVGGGYDGRIKVVTLVVAYDDPASTTETRYWVNQGHDSCSYYTEDYEETPAVGSTTFATNGITGITSAKLIIDYMASNNGYYGFPTAENDFTYTGGAPPVEGTFTNIALDNVADAQGPYSGRDSWTITSSVEGKSSVTLGYARYFPASGLAQFYKIPLAFLVVKKTLAVPAPVAAFTATPTSGTAPLTVVFTDQSTNTPTSWSWTIEGIENTDYQYVDSTSSTLQNPHVKFLKAGIYDATLTATNAGGSGTLTKPDYITVTVPTIEVTLGSSSVTLANMVRGSEATGSTTVNVVASNGASWSVAAADGKTTNKGYMVSGTTPLAGPFQLGKNGAAYQDLRSDYTSFMSGSTMGSFSATASLKQPVATGDGTGTYGITVTFTGAIS